MSHSASMHVKVSNLEALLRNANRLNKSQSNDSRTAARSENQSKPNKQVNKDASR